MNREGRPIHFLLVEDDEAHAELVIRSLELNKIANTIDRVSDGLEALAYLRHEEPFADCLRPDVVLLDLKLPRMDGHEVLEAIKADLELSTIPVVVLTTSSNKADCERAYQLNANSYVSKPLDFSKFQQMVKDLQLYWSIWNHSP